MAGTAFGDVGASRLANAYFVVQGVVPELYFVVQSSTGVVLCSTRSSTGVVLCSTELVLE